MFYRNVIDVVDDTMLVFDPKESSDDFFFHGQRQQRRDLNKKVNRDQKFAFDTVYGPNSTNGDIFEGTYIGMKKANNVLSKFLRFLLLKFIFQFF